MATGSGFGIDMVASYLEEQGVAHEVVEHPTRYSAAADARAAGLEPDDAAKTILLRDDEGYKVVVIPASHRLDLHKLRELLGADSSLRLAAEHEIAADFEAFEVGAVPPFGPLLPAPEVVDRRLLEHDRVMCSGGDHRHGVMLDPNEIVRIAKPQVGDVCQD
jgi:Ala-tRNA(Pro) deacylase